jgi:putative phosphoesterase
MLIRAGVLSDTHLTRADARFRQLIQRCFHDCDLIIHAGDLTDLSVLDVFAGKTVHAVHGNMCQDRVKIGLPEHRRFTLGRFVVGLAHGDRLGRDIEQGLWHLFADADCLIYGHTHRPICHRCGGVLFLNPGSFRGTGPHGAPGTYAILEAGDELTARLLEVPAHP